MSFLYWARFAFLLLMALVTVILIYAHYHSSRLR